MTTNDPTTRLGSAISSSAANFSAIFSGSANPMMICDNERRYLEANDAALAVLRLSHDDVVERRIDDLTPPENLGGMEGMWAQFLEAGSMAGQFEMLRGDGSRILVSFNATANVVPGVHLTIFIDTANLDSALPVEIEDEEHGDNGTVMTPREREVLRLVAYGYTGNEIAEKCGISPDTVRVHVRNAIRKLGARTRAQAIGIAVSRGEI